MNLFEYFDNMTTMLDVFLFIRGHFLFIHDHSQVGRIVEKNVLLLCLVKRYLVKWSRFKVEHY